METKKIGQLNRNLVDLEAFSEIELTEEEVKLALLDARHKKYAQIKQSEYVKKLHRKIEFPGYSAEEVKDMVSKNGKMIIDEFNEEIIWQLCLYFTGDVRCALDKKKGILLYGGVGCGKTSLMNFFRHNQTNSYSVFSVREISYDYSKHGSDVITKFKHLLPTPDVYKTYGQGAVGACFDDLGTEVDKKHYGNESNVMAEILLNRYDSHNNLAGKTHITTNLNTTQLEERYGQRVRSRLREMFNVLIFDDKAPDRRK